MFCAIGQCRCLSTYVAVDAYCYEKISPSDSGCFYDIQCASVWPDSYCKSGQCMCPSDDMIAVKTKDGTLCVWSTTSEPSCPLPSLPPPDSPSSLVVLPAAAGKTSVTIAPCNPHSSENPKREEDFLAKQHDFKCSVRGFLGDEPEPQDVSDLYDCIDNSKFWKDQGMDTTSHPIGVCCMNRAFTSCPRGNPAYLSTKGSPNSARLPQTGCSTANPCTDPFVCTEVASQSMCCASRKSICSEAGARIKDALRSTPYDAGHRFDQLTGETANYAVGISTRYYYNPTDGQCHPFTFNGFLGNFNNFQNQADCQLFCARLQCPHGSPLTNGNGSPQRCARDTDCPSTHTCAMEHQVCCPTPPEPKCPQGRAYVDFSGKFMQCGEGLGGTACPANYECTFDGLVYGCCPSKAYTCSLQVNKGIGCGSGSSYRYYYNNQAKECQSFLFLGCDGNSNNFPSIEKCQNYCEIAICPNGGSPLRANSKVRSCSTHEPCPTGYDCSIVEANGVMQRRCCPSKVSICSKPPQMGMLPKCSSGSGQTRFYFNMALQTCSSYTSNGCDTSLNSFNSISECEDFCMSAGCSLGDTVYKDPNTNKPFVCNTALQNNCPANYECTLNALTQEHTCCGSDGMGVCPTGEKAFMDPRTNTPRQCAMAADGKCPGGYLCRFSQSNHKYYCCGNIQGTLCPSGRSLYRYATTQLPVQCHISPLQSSCPNGFACMSDVQGAFQGYCCSHNPICPGEVAFHQDEKTQLPTTCTNEGFSFCPTGYTCQQQPDTLNFYCCQGEEKHGINDGCPPGQYAYVQEEGVVKSCDPFMSDEACPVEFTCQWSLTNQKYQCCGTRPTRAIKPTIFDDGCPTKQFALIDKRSNQTRACTAGEAKSCPIGFFCQFSAKKGQFQCCGQSGGCPIFRAAFIAIDGNAQECLPGPDMCSDGYECVKSTTHKNKNICCSKEEGGCADNEILVDGACVVRVKVGGGCHTNEECVDGADCVENVCKCSSSKAELKGECVDGACTEDQIRLDGKCESRAKIGEPCKSSLQCHSNSRCISGICGCAKGEVPDGGACKKGAEPKSKPPGKTQICLDKDEQAYILDEKLLSCFLTDDHCPTGYKCQYSEEASQNVCCGTAPKNQTTVTPPTTTVGSIVVTKKSKPVKAQHCPAQMSPYLVNGRAKSCATTSCPYGYQCKFSNTAKDYFCCSKQTKKSNSNRIRGGGCERGNALLYPSTQEAVQCDPLARGCPQGYLCLPHVNTKKYQCCSVSASRDNADEAEIVCPSYMVKMVQEVDGKPQLKCVKSCPAGQKAVDGLCTAE
uniref:Kunitz/Bovine pancreatic trypsin inhibitor domain protein n=1 Tax=Caenorhabditis tropicalis TaxID=1561998 RepID=A0A1I7UZ71_9PELO